MPQKLTKQRIYEPTYQLESKTKIIFDHIQLIIRNCLMQEVEFSMPTYDRALVMRFVKDVAGDIKFRIQIQNFDRFRTVVIVNTVEKGHQGFSWQVGTLMDPNNDKWTSYRFETPTYIVSIFVACVYWD